MRSDFSLTGEVMVVGLAVLNQLIMVMVTDQTLGDVESFVDWGVCHTRRQSRAASQTYTGSGSFVP